MARRSRTTHVDPFVADADFNEQLYEALRRSPWWLTSLLVHVFAVGAFLMMGSTEAAAPEAQAAITVAPPEDPFEIDDEPVQHIEDPVPMPIPREPKVTDEPTPDPPMDDTDNLLAEDTYGLDVDAPNAGVTEGPSNQSPIGVGPGGASPFGPRGPGGPNDGGGGGGGPTKQMNDALDDALQWLMMHQSANGSWEAFGFADWFDGKRVPAGEDRPDGRGKQHYDVGVTGLALCAYLGAGYTNRGNHPYNRVVAMGLRYLKNVQDPEGCFGTRSTQQYIYNHAIAALAMVEAYGMTGSPIFKGAAQRALDFIALARNPYGAWRYGVKPGDNDTSVMGWMMMALKSASLINKSAVRRGKRAPLVIDESAFGDMQAWLRKVTDPDTGNVGYLTRGGGSARPQELVDRFPSEKTAAMTAVGMLARTFAGEDPAKSAIIRKGADRCLERLPRWNTTDGSVDMYYWYYATLAMYQVGGAPWKKWGATIETAMVQTQRQDGGHRLYKGSWDPAGPWGADGGRVYSTAMLAMCLEVHHRYDRVFTGSR